MIGQSRVERRRDLGGPLVVGGASSSPERKSVERREGTGEHESVLLGDQVGGAVPHWGDRKQEMMLMTSSECHEWREEGPRSPAATTRLSV